MVGSVDDDWHEAVLARRFAAAFAADDVDAQRRRRVIETYEANRRTDRAAIDRAELAVVDGYLLT